MLVLFDKAKGGRTGGGNGTSKDAVRESGGGRGDEYTDH